MGATVVYKSKAEANRRQQRKQDIVDREIEAMTRSLGHVPTTEQVLEAATDEEHPLHRYFTWNDQEAAHEYRLTEAYRLLQSCKFVVEMNARESKQVEVRKLVVVHEGEPMWLRNKAMAEPDARQKLKAKAIGELRSWCRRFVDLPEVDAIRREIEKWI